MLHTSWRSKEHKNSKAAAGIPGVENEYGTKLGLTTYFPFSFRLLIIIIDVWVSARLDGQSANGTRPSKEAKEGGRPVNHMQ